MTQPDGQVRLRHLTEAARKAVGYATERSREDLDDDELLAHETPAERIRNGDFKSVLALIGAMADGVVM